MNINPDKFRDSRVTALGTLSGENFRDCPAYFRRMLSGRRHDFNYFSIIRLI